jgi:hypothetical protein
MRRESSLTFRGALEILGHHDRPVIEKLDKILGGVILASGAAAGVAAVAGLALPPAGLWAAIWGWTEQKDAALGLLRKAFDSATGKLRDMSGYERRQVIAAAHTTVVVAAFFEAFREEIGNKVYNQLNLNDAQKVALVSGESRDKSKALFEILYSDEVPIPSPSRGFEENVSHVCAWLGRPTGGFKFFEEKMATAGSIRVDWARVSVRATEHYRSHFLELAAAVPEFAMWAMLGEHAATRSLVRQQSEELAAAICYSTAAMGRVEALLALTSKAAGFVPDLRAIVNRENRRVLSESIIPDSGRQGSDLAFPPVGRMYINPRFRVALFSQDVNIADEHWWNGVPSDEEFDLMLAAHITTPDATRLPMLVLGDPGAGKSLLTRVLAARLGGGGYTVVHVPLRRVGASAPIGHQIQHALDEATAERVKWADLSDQSIGATRVVLLDGLDELLQASSSDRSGYLQEVAAFQDAEAAQERPLVVIVTSRIVVADRVDIPYGTVVVKLDTFSDEDIADWLCRWQDGNSAAIDAGKVRALTAEEALRQPELARQPLLLLMLAVYAADPAMPPLDADLSTADLYRNILEEFGRREARKALGDYARGRQLSDRVQDHLDRLAIAALAMFNRGRQDISEDELGTDLKALDEHLMGRTRPEEAGQRVIGEFFFVHAPQARMMSQGKQSRRSYEFLHATFGEYLVASHVMDELAEVTRKAFVGRRGPSVPEDDLLFAMLSHQPLAARKSTLTFAEQIANGLPPAERARLLDVLEMLLRTYRERDGSAKYSSYRPTPKDTIRQLACYSANLVSLRVTLEPDHASVPLTTLLRVQDDDGLPQWRSTVMLWQSGLDASSMQAMLSVIKFSASPPGIHIVEPGEWLGEEGALVARLLGDRPLEWRIQYGAAIRDGEVRDASPHALDWVNEMSRALIPLAAGLELHTRYVIHPPEGLSEQDYQHVATLIINYLRNAGPHESSVDPLIRILLQLPREVSLNEYVIARSVILRPELVDSHPRLRDHEIYGRFYELIGAIGTPDLRREIGYVNRSSRRVGVESMRNLLTRVVYEASTNRQDAEPEDDYRIWRDRLSADERPPSVYIHRGE